MPGGSKGSGLGAAGYAGPMSDATREEPREVRSPHDGAVVGRVHHADAAAMERAIEQARAAAGSVPPAHRRAAILEEAARRIGEDREAFALRIAREGGKPLVDARVEVDRATGGLSLLAGEALRAAGEEVPMGGSAASEGRLAFTTLEPIGLSASISAFNHPLNLAVHQIGPAIAAGCPFIHKPAVETPLSAMALLSALHAAGWPERAGAVVPCDVEVAQLLATSERIAHLSFIGSAAVGWKLRSLLAPGVRCALEHGGAAPVIVDRSADLERAVPAIAKGGFYHAGQVCVSVQRVFVHAERASELEARLVEAARSLRVGDPTSPDTDVGPLIRERDVDRVLAWTAEAVAAGARLATGGARVGPRHIAPTVLVDPPEGSRVMTEEIFGPVICLASVASLDEAIARANAVRWSFQSAIFTGEVAAALEAARRLDAATVLVNDHTAFRVDWMPFGGRGRSGLGVGGLGPATRDLLQQKLIVLRA